jgi:hypothetical protein
MVGDFAVLIAIHGGGERNGRAPRAVGIQDKSVFGERRKTKKEQEIGGCY